MTSPGTPTPPADESANRPASEAKPTLTLLPAGIPSLDDLVMFFRKLTGREPDPEDVKQTGETLATLQSKRADERSKDGGGDKPTGESAGCSYLSGSGC
jgi:hypothetical protein